MSCPYLKDYLRLCVNNIGMLPKASYKNCYSDDFTNCPFFIRKETPEKTCKNINKCPFFNNFTMLDFDEFIDIANEFCLSKNNINCQRYILKEKGEKVPKDLHPSGKIIERKI